MAKSQGKTQAQQAISDKVKRAFKEMDQDNNGVVTFREFRDFCKRTVGLEGVAEAFCQADTSRDQQITLEELNDLCMRVPKDQIEECHVTNLFHQLDRSKDGRLDKNEFRALLCKCGFKEDQLMKIFDQVAGDDGEISLEEFLTAFRKG